MASVTRNNVSPPAKANESGLSNDRLDKSGQQQASDRQKQRASALAEASAHTKKTGKPIVVSFYNEWQDKHNDVNPIESRATMDGTLSLPKPPAPPAGMKFLGWYNTDTNRPVNTSSVFTRDTSLYAMHGMADNGDSSTRPIKPRAGVGALDCTEISSGADPDTNGYKIYVALKTIIKSISVGEAAAESILSVGIKNVTNNLDPDESFNSLKNVAHILANLTCNMSNEMCCAINGLMWCGSEVPCAESFSDIEDDLADIVNSVLGKEELTNKLVCAGAEILNDLGGGTTGDYTTPVYAGTLYSDASKHLSKVNDLLVSAGDIECAVAKELCLAVNAFNVAADDTACARLTSPLVDIVSTIAAGDHCASGILHMSNDLLTTRASGAGAWSATQVNNIYSDIENMVKYVTSFRSATSQKLCTAMSILCDGCGDAVLPCSKDGSSNGKSDCSTSCSGGCSDG